MKRIHLFEFEDFSWFPGWLRECMTRYIMAIHKLLNTSDDLAVLLSKLLGQTHSNQIIDLCSGSGGPMLEVREILISEYGYNELDLTLSDLYPHKEIASRINNFGNPKIKYVLEPVNAADLDKDQKGVRTLVCSMHHMKREIAREILKDAYSAKQPICIFEISDNATPKWLWWIAIPINFLSVFFITPLVRPMTWKQIVFTYLIPLLPIFIAWDGAVSNARTYTLSDLDVLLKGMESESYTWEKATIKGKVGNKLYLLGYPIGEKQF
mgnify:CR=1 FL=1